MSIQPDWLVWARKLQALAQTRLTYAENPYDKERYRQLHDVAAEIFAAHTGQTVATIEQWFAIQPGYATPKGGADAAVVEGEAARLDRRRGPLAATDKRSRLIVTRERPATAWSRAVRPPPPSPRKAVRIAWLSPPRPLASKVRADRFRQFDATTRAQVRPLAEEIPREFLRVEATTARLTHRDHMAEAILEEKGALVVTQITGSAAVEMADPLAIERHGIVHRDRLLASMAPQHWRNQGSTRNRSVNPGLSAAARVGSRSARPTRKTGASG